MAIPTILIVGRPNVGKSTLFNRICKERKAIVYDFPGVTRDLITSFCTWNHKQLLLVDSGGIFLDPKDNSQQSGFQGAIENKVKEALDTADLVLFMVDTREGIIPNDKIIAGVLREMKEKVLLVPNKADTEDLAHGSSEFFALGFDSIFPISATQNSGVDDLFEAAFSMLPDSKQGLNKNISTGGIKVSIVGRPNVGKSSLLNCLSGTETALVSDIPGTTRDSIDLPVIYHEKPYLFIDTAGIKKKMQHDSDQISFYSYIRTIKAIQSSDIVLFMMDANEMATDQDKHIAALIEESGRSMIFLINKWDTIKKDSHTITYYEKWIKDKFSFLSYAPILFISAITKKRVQNTFELIDEVYLESKKRIPTPEINNFLKHIKQRHSQQTNQFRNKIKYLTQAEISPPLFILFVGTKHKINLNFRRFLIRQMREKFGFSGVPIKLAIKEKAAKEK
jgi:GTPase